MTLISEPALEKHALRHADALAKRIVDGETSYDVGAASFEWNARFRRYVYEQALVVWRDIGPIEITLTPDRKYVRSFRDPRRLEAKIGARLDEKQLLAIAATTGLVGKLARIGQVEPGPLYHLVLSQLDAGKPRRIAMTINAARRQVAAFEVLEDGR